MLPSQLPVFTVLVFLIALALAGCLDDDPDDLDDGEDFSGPVSASGNETADENGNGTAGGNDGNNTGDNQEPPSGGDDNKTDDGDGGADNETTYFDPGWPEIGAAAIRPGVSIAGGCTANFIFSSPDNRTLYIGTASHCVGGQDVNDTISIAGGHSGTLVYCSWMHTEGADHCPDGDGFVINSNDFALVEIDGEDRGEVHPALLHWGGPTALGDPPSAGTKLLSYGDSKPGPLRPIEGYALQSSSESTTMYAVAPGIPGDSGSPVIQADGSTVGALVGLGIAPLPGSNSISNLKNALDFMTQETGLQVDLKTWETLNAGLLP